MKNKIALFPLVLLIISAIDSIRTLPTTAFFGSSLVFFYLLSALIFLMPVAFISAEFGSRFPEEGGVFHWVRRGFGNRAGVLASWLQWVNTMVWYPTMLVFISGTLAYLIEPTLIQSKVYLLFSSVGIFWILTVLNLRGIQVSVKMNSICGTVGTLVPMIFLICLGVGWIFSDHSSAIRFSANELFPRGRFIENSGVIVTIMASFLGMELAGVHINDVFNPQRNFPKAVGFSVLILSGTLILGSLAVAVVVPKDSIHFVDGVMQTFTTFLSSFNMPFLIPLLAILIVLGSAGGSINWLISPAKGLFQAAEYGFLPPFFLSKNRRGVPSKILITQALVVSAFCILMQLFSSLNEFYWFLMALSTGLYMIMYVLMFLSALKLGRPIEGYRIPKGFRTSSCILGIFACFLTIAIGFQPPEGVAIESRLGYFFITSVGFMCMIAPVFYLWSYQKKGESLQSEN